MSARTPQILSSHDFIQRSRRSSSSFASTTTQQSETKNGYIRANTQKKKKKRIALDKIKASTSSSESSESSSSASSSNDQQKNNSNNLKKLEWFNFGPRGTMKQEVFQTRSPLHVNTPLIYSQVLSEINERIVYLKLDNCQPSGSFKLRGLGYACMKAVEIDGKRTFVSSSGGNAGLGVAYSGLKLNVKTTVVVPETTPVFIRDRLKSLKAKVIVHGKQWSEANELAMKIAKEEDAFFAHPFEGEDTWTGHATVVHEMCAQLRDAGETKPPSFVCTVCGGGGLLLGIAQGLREVGWAKTDVIVSETIGCDSLYQSIKENKLITLDAITSIAKSLGAAQVSPSAFDLTKQYKREGKSPRIHAKTVTDAEALLACKRFANDHRILVEPACGAALALAYDTEIFKSTKNDANENSCVVIEVCGGAIVDLNSFN
jgi:L-serine/L-threonine ammonia-lyase